MKAKGKSYYRTRFYYCLPLFYFKDVLSDLHYEALTASGKLGRWQKYLADRFRIWIGGQEAKQHWYNECRTWWQGPNLAEGFQPSSRAAAKKSISTEIIFEEEEEEEAEEIADLMGSDEE